MCGKKQCLSLFALCLVTPVMKQVNFHLQYLLTENWSSAGSRGGHLLVMPSSPVSFHYPLGFWTVHNIVRDSKSR